MEDDSYIPFTQLWKGEQAVLRQIAAAVLPSGVIVEIGTAEGGTALLMYRAVAHKGVHIYTIDVAPSPKAREHLRDTDVTMIVQPSAEAARGWQHAGGRAIDLLLIDGSHQLQDVVDDFNLWVPHLRPGGVVVFHDYDPVERGGVVHLAVRLCVDAVLEAGFLKDPVHRYKLLYGAVERPARAAVTARLCYDRLADLARRVALVRAIAEEGAALVADDRFAFLLRGCLPRGDVLDAISPSEAVDPQRRYLVCGHPSGLPLDVLRAQGTPWRNLIVIDSVTACYLLADALRSNFPYLCAHTASLNELLFWAETLAMHEHGCGDALVPHGVAAIARMDLPELSRLVAREQVRLTILARILRTFVDWVP